MVTPGLRVVRGPDWEWQDQDGGEGHAGTVVNVDGMVVVQWDNGYRAKYRCGGATDKYDLRVVDSGPAGEVHAGLACSWCDESPVVGTLWKCVYCLDYYLCMVCYMTDKHSVLHPFEYCQASDLRNRVRVPPRILSEKKSLYGLYPEASVVRGRDWKWGDQDGGQGNKGYVIKIENWKDETFRSVAVVSWTHAISHNVYRRAHRGMVDIRCVEATSGGSYYPDHLPVLGREYLLHVDSPVISAGDTVMVNMDPDLFQIAQQDYGGWDDSMAEVIGEVGRVNSIVNGSMMVFYINKKRFMINSIAVQKVDYPFLDYGATVQVTEDLVEVQKLQKNHGGWADNMTTSLGQVGRVINCLQNTLRVAVNGRRWTFNPKCLVPVKEGATYKEEDENDVFIPEHLRPQLLALLQSGSTDLMLGAAEAGDAATLAMYLSQHPEQVKSVGGNSPAVRAMVHAIKEDHKPVIRVFLDHGLDVNSTTEDGRGYLHHAAIMGNYDLVSMLLERGADVNLPDCQIVTPLALASMLGSWRVVKILVDHPATNLDCQTSEGDTPLHLASMHQHWMCCRLLLEYGADPSLYSYQMTTPLHRICQTGFLAGLEQMIRYHPEHINLKKDDAFTPLHMAALNNHVDLVAFLISHPSCNINGQTSDRVSALHLSAYSGHISIIEMLVGYGADINITSSDGSSVLHVILAKNNMNEPDEYSPRLRMFKDDFESTHGRGLLSMGTIVALFLAANGADIKLKNLLGKTPVNCVSRDVRELLITFSTNRDTFHGSLKQKAQPFSDPPRAIRSRSLRSPSSADYSSTTQPTSDNLPPQSDSALPSLNSEDEVRERNNSYSDNSEEFSAKKKSTTAPQAVAKLQQNSTEPGKGTNSGGKKLTMTMPQRATVAAPEAPASPSTPSIATLSLHSLHPSSDNNSDDDFCLLCDERCDTVFLPCGHSTMCHNCFKAAKKCSRCKQKVEVHLVVCAICHTRNCIGSPFPCGHCFCSECRGHNCRVCYKPTLQ